MNDIAVVTAVTNNYDYQGSHRYSPDVDYLFFTDGTCHPPERPWREAHLTHIERDARRNSKQPKLNPHSIPLLAQYNYVIWIDGSMQIINAEFPHEILSYLSHGLVLSPHFDNRDCAYGEATIRPTKYQNEPLDEQIAFYESEGFPHHYGLYECGVLARDMTVSKVEELGAMWQQQNFDWSYQDQVSLPYCLWKTHTTPDVLPQSFRYMNWVHVNAHRSEL